MFASSQKILDRSFFFRVQYEAASSSEVMDASSSVKSIDGDTSNNVVAAAKAMTQAAQH